MPKTIDDEIDEAVSGLGVLFDGVDDGTLVFVPAEDFHVEDLQGTADAIMERLQGGRFSDLADYPVRLVA